MESVEVMGIDCRTIVVQKSLFFTSWEVKQKMIRVFPCVSSKTSPNFNLSSEALNLHVSITNNYKYISYDVFAT